MEGDDREPALRLEHPLRRRKRQRQLLELPIHIDAQGLESTGRGVNALLRTLPSRGLLDGPHQRPRCNYGLFDPRIHDRPGDGAGFALLTQYADDAGELVGLGPVHDVGRRKACLLHPHVERTFLGEGEAARRFVDLHRGHADIEGGAVDHGDAETGGERLHVAEAAFDQHQAVGKIGDECRTAGDRLWIAVDGEDLALGRGEKPPRIAAGTEGPVDIDAAIARRQCGEHLREHHRPVPGICAGR